MLEKGFELCQTFGNAENARKCQKMFYVEMNRNIFLVVYKHLNLQLYRFLLAQLIKLKNIN